MFSMIKAALINLLVSTFGESFRPFFEKYLGEAANAEPDIVVGVGAAPDDVKNLIRSAITDLVSRAFSNRPLIKGFALTIVKNLPDSWIDNLWDSIFAAKIKAGELPAASTFAKSGTVTVPAPLQLSADDFHAVKMEAGLAT